MSRMPFSPSEAPVAARGLLERDLDEERARLVREQEPAPAPPLVASS